VLKGKGEAAEKEWKNYEDHGEPNIFYHKEENPKNGYVYWYYKNASESTLVEDIVLVDSKNAVFRKPN